MVLHVLCLQESASQKINPSESLPPGLLLNQTPSKLIPTAFKSDLVLVSGTLQRLTCPVFLFLVQGFWETPILPVSRWLRASLLLRQSCSSWTSHWDAIVLGFLPTNLELHRADLALALVLSSPMKSHLYVWLLGGLRDPSWNETSCHVGMESHILLLATHRGLQGIPLQSPTSGDQQWRDNAFAYWLCGWLFQCLLMASDIYPFQFDLSPPFPSLGLYSVQALHITRWEKLQWPEFLPVSPSFSHSCRLHGFQFHLPPWSLKSLASNFSHTNYF